MNHFPIVDIELELKYHHLALGLLSIVDLPAELGETNLGWEGRGGGYEKGSISYSLVVLLYVACTRDLEKESFHMKFFSEYIHFKGLHCKVDPLQYQKYEDNLLRRYLGLLKSIK